MSKHPKLPSDILFDILSGLPVKSVLRFKCVSKEWCSLISDPKFAKNHLKRTKKDKNFNPHKICLSSTPLLLSIDPEACCDGDGNLVTTQLSFPGRNLERDFEIVGFCDGLGCAAFYHPHPMIVWNPSTGDYKELPKSNPLPAEGKYFDGFGYDRLLDDYKIVRGSISTSVNNGSNHKAIVEVLTLKSNMWRTIQNLEYGILFKGLGTYANGALHWLAKRKSVSGKIFVIVSFDLAEEKFLEMIPAPGLIYQDYLSLKLKLLRDCLCVYSTCNYGYVYPSFSEVWVLKDYKAQASWTRLNRFSCEELPVCRGGLDLLFVTEDDKVWLDLDGLELVLYNPRQDTCKRFTILHEWDWFVTTMYTESLVSPNVS